MKKLIASSLVMIIGLSVLTGKVSAREGAVDLTSSEASCKGVSIYQDGYYRVTGRCDGLVYPFETTYNKYVLWGKTVANGEMVRIAEVDRGYFSGNISSAFEGMYITAEHNGLVRKPSDRQVLAGKVNVFDFDKSKVTTAPATSTNTTSTATTTKTTDTATTATTSTAGAIIGKIVTSLLVVILVIVGLAIGASLLFRGRGSVST